MLEIELDLAVGKSRQIGCHLLLIAGTMAPLHQITMHLVGCQLHQFISFLARLHVLQFLEDFEKHGTIMAHRNTLVRIFHVFGFLGYLCSIAHIERIIDVELETAHDSEMIPELLLMVLHTSVFRKHAIHDLDDRFGTALALLAVFQLHTVIHHLLNLTPVFRQHELFSRCIIV